MSFPPLSLSTFLDYPLDTIPGLYALHGACRIVGNYRGPLYNVVRENDGATLDVYAPFSSAYGWPSVAALSAWSGGSPLNVAIVYDQSGNGRTLIQATTGKQPLLRLDGQYPIFEFQGYDDYFDGTASLSAFTQNANGATVLAVRRHTLTTATERVLLSITTGTGVGRAGLDAYSTTGTECVSARRLDADSLLRPAGFPCDTNWAVEIGNWSWSTGSFSHTRSEIATGVTLSESGTLASGSGATSNTASTAVYVGQDSSLNRFAGELACIAWISRSITATEMTNLNAAFIPHQTPMVEPNQFLQWSPTFANKGPYTLAPGAVTKNLIYTSVTGGVGVQAIDGTTPTAGDLASHRYHHHSRIAYFNGMLWVAHSSALNNEDSAGEFPVFWTSSNGGTTWTGPGVAIPSQETMGDTYGSSDVVVQTNSFQVYGGNLYLICPITASTQSVSYGLLAVQCNSNGTVGSPFRITPTAYSLPSAFPTIAYNSTLGPPLLALAQLWGTWGGAKVGYAQGDFIGYYTQGGTNESWTEPVTIPMDSTGLNYQRLLRKVAGYSGGGLSGQNRWYSMTTKNAGATWSSIVPTRIPNASGAGAAMQLPDGRIALVGNPMDTTGFDRDPLYLALFNGTTGMQTKLYAVQQGVTQTPLYAGNAKAGGCQYPSITFDGTNIWLAYSIQKESIAVTMIPLAGL